jgi:hypothetical protein
MKYAETDSQKATLAALEKDREVAREALQSKGFRPA